ncbi:family 16 glycoside hydrolase [Halorubrum sp. CSM-61]|uniref:family 16 glycoside hydrolase n=1 Tax=Halorubrum sp. CSM-61 TaxID=2485838 RepID=UPI000F4B2358|nr:family 16 glycoside hydrolase [Halorubrum sp. CSM-61]
MSDSDQTEKASGNGRKTANRRRVLQGIGAVGMSGSLAGLGTAQPDEGQGEGRGRGSENPGRGRSEIPTSTQFWTYNNSDLSVAELVYESANAGYDTVEPYYIDDEEAVATALEETGLELSSAHVGIEQLEDNFEETIETYSEFGADALIHAYKGDGTWESEDGIVEWAERVNEMADRVAEEGMEFGYHNHDQEFQTIDGTFGFDIFAQHVNDNVHLQLDVGWALVGGADPVAVLNRHRDKVGSLHMKDMTADGEFTEIGEGDVNMTALANVARNNTDVDYLIYEYDGAPEPVHSLYYGAEYLDRINGPQERPPRVVPGDDGLSGDPPSDATVLWDGDEATLEGWEHTDGSEAEWNEAEDGEYFEVNLGSGNVRTGEAFGDCHLHLEWRVPEEYDGYVDVENDGDGQTPGNSGVFLMETYEIQVLQSHDNPTYPSGYAGSFYLASPEGGAVPLVLPINPPGEWNAYDVLWRGPRFDDGELQRYPQLTVLFNGVAVINHFDVPGPNYWVDLFEDEFDNDTNPHPQDDDGNFLEEAPLVLQDHGAETDEVHYRNVWYRDLPESPVEIDDPSDVPDYDSERGVWEEREDWPDRDAATDLDHPDHPEQIEPGEEPGDAPSDADLLIDDELTLEPGDGDWTSDEAYGDAQIHVEFRVPEDVEGDGTDRGNSGVLLFGRYELQILDTYMNRVDLDEWAGAYVDQAPPHHDAVRRPGEWQQLDIVWQGPRFEDGDLVREAQTTAFLNGVAVQTRLQVEGPNADGSLDEYEAHDSELPLRLTEEGSRMQFRNTWARSLD